MPQGILLFYVGDPYQIGAEAPIWKAQLCKSSFMGSHLRAKVVGELAHQRPASKNIRGATRLEIPVRQ